MALPTLTVSEGCRGNRQTYARGNPTLTGVFLPNLTRRDEKGPAPKHSKGGRDLPGTLGGHLNVTWCLWYMGFPEGWLDVDDAQAFAR